MKNLVSGSTRRKFSGLKVKSFTLSELLVVLVIIGILVLMALPVLMPLISRTRSVEAKQGLKHIYTLEKTFFYEFSKYSSDLEKIGFEQEKLITETSDGKSNYTFEIISADTRGFLVKATAVVDFDGDGEFNVWEINENNDLVEVVKD
ncbi:type IV pilin protein [Ohtaekwangia koreensis]|uniref:Type IV pilus assembly protein PilE n=1 Tax=Ohtaekwangia koreensis TaxID=688867 RepID=A0A1T5K709_9BACT|nr:prepilin-type N-terminal cleavage/methylation domain-containing protein [Ohtaekwangia koreensis]SKC59238.1 type IV pilus assembly protein PilE [Ohtaekwangia koreensis]